MNNKKIWLPFIVLFIVLNGFFIIGRNWLLKQGVDNEVLITGNLILFIATLLSVVIYLRSLQSSTGSAALKGMYGSFLVKFFTCLVAAFAYIMIAKKDVNKPALMICLGLYVVYTVIEVSSLQKILRQKKNA